MRTNRFDTPGAVRLRIDNASGSVSITTHDQPVTEVELSMEGAGGDESLIEEARVEAVATDGGYDVFVEIPRPKRGGGLASILRLLDLSQGVSIVVRAPGEARADVTTASARVEASGQLSEFIGKTASGSVSVEQTSDDFRVRTASGSVTARTVGGAASVQVVSGRVKIDSVAGEASVSSTSGRVVIDTVNGKLEAKTVSGSIEIGSAASDVRISTVSGSLRLERCRNGVISMRSVSGSVVVGVAEGSALHVDAQSVSGSLESEIELSDNPRAGGPPPEHTVDLEVRSVSGNVRVVRAEADAG